jgi:RHS repeat-associated protein
VGVLSAQLTVFNEFAWTCTARPVQVFGLAGPFDENTVWSNQPAVDGSGPVATAWFNYGAAGCAGQNVTLDVTSLARRWADGTQANHGLVIQAEDEANDQAAFKRFSSGDAMANRPTLVVAYQTTPSAPALVSPEDGATVLTTTPALKVSSVVDPDASGPVRYRFTVTSRSEAAEPGQVIDSGWVGSPSWTAPVGELVDGTTYWWSAVADDSSGAHVSAGPSRSFTVRTSTGWGASDGAGPVSIDLGTGAMSTAVAGPSMPTPGGGIQAVFSYRSQTEQALGLMASFFNDADNDQVGDANELVVSRLDRQVSFDWGVGAPSPGVGVDRWVARWDGFVKVPVTGAYSFGASHDNRVRVDIGGGGYELDRWSDGQVSVAPVFGSSVNLTAGVATPISVEFYDRYGDAHLSLVYDDAGTVRAVPASWFVPWDAPAVGTGPTDVLPLGWSLSFPTVASLEYTAVTLTDDAVTLSMAGGGTVTYTWNGSSWVSGLPGDLSVVRLDDDGILSVQSGFGLTYVFNADGTLASATTAADGNQEVTPAYTYTNVTVGGSPVPRLTSITDPVSGRSVNLVYKSGGNCPTYFHAPPEGMLCDVAYWDGTHTLVAYLNGTVARIINPGSATMDFVYSAGLMTGIRDVLASDAVAAGSRPANPASRWQVAYDTSTPPRAVSVTAPEPTVGAARAKRTVTYTATGADVVVAGFSPPAGYARRVGFDGDGRVVSERDGDGRETSTTWSADGWSVVATEGPGNPERLRSTFQFDGDGRPTGSFGPAPVSWFASDGMPTPAHASDVPHVSQAYDESIDGLAWSWWDNPGLDGQPVGFGTGLGAGGSVDGAWTTSPWWGQDDNWSLRLTGQITFPDAGLHYLRVRRDGKIRVWLDGGKVIDDWVESTTNQVVAVNVAAGERRSIVIEYADTANLGLLALDVMPSGGAYSVVPGSDLRAGYGLVTSGVGADGRVVEAQYQEPQLGLQTGVVVDPGGVGAVTAAGYEPSGLRRPTSRTLPSGDAVTTSYYALGESRDNPCTVAVDVVDQVAGQKLLVNPTPASGVAVTEEVVYDVVGRVVASRRNADPWSCATFDARGRVAGRVTPGFGGEPARSVGSNFAVGGDPLTSSVSDAAGTVTTTVDLLGRPVSVTDVWGRTTVWSFDQAGRRVSQVWSGSVVTQWLYDVSGRVSVVKLDGQTVATVAYDAVTGRPSGYSYPSGSGNAGNGTLSGPLVYDGVGRLVGLSWLDPGSLAATITSSARTVDVAGRVVDESVDGVDPRPAGVNYVYDGLGRLVEAHVPGHVYGYGFAAAGGCGVSVDAGLNSNRTSLTDNGATVAYCYDRADRLTSTTQPGMASIVYDSHGNTVILGADSMVYDGDDRHVATTGPDGFGGTVTVRYVRDASDGIVERRENSVVVARYSGPVVLDASNMPVQDSHVLPGGVLLTRQAAGNVWSYPNLAGHVVASANQAGVKQGPTVHYDPYGNPLGLLIDNQAGSFDLGWSPQRTEHAGALNTTVEMGARLYSPVLGRFLEPDPILGGSANDYDYAGSDPNSRQDYSGATAEDYRNLPYVASSSRVWNVGWASFWQIESDWSGYFCDGLCRLQKNTNANCISFGWGLCLFHHGYQISKKMTWVSIGSVRWEVQVQMVRHVYTKCTGPGAFMATWNLYCRGPLTDGEWVFAKQLQIWIGPRKVGTYCLQGPTGGYDGPTGCRFGRIAGGDYPY